MFNNLKNAKLVAQTAKKMRVETKTLETLFRGPTTEIKLKRDEYKDDKKHGWLDNDKRFETGGFQEYVPILFQ